MSEKPTTRVHHHTSSTMSSSVSSSPIPLEFEFDVAQQTTPISEETSPEPGTNTAASSPPPHASSEYSFASSELAEVCICFLRHVQFCWITATCQDTDYDTTKENIQPEASMTMAEMVCKLPCITNLLNHFYRRQSVAWKSSSTFFSDPQYFPVSSKHVWKKKRPGSLPF